MIVEHTFITTKERDEVFTLIEGLLQQLQFPSYTKEENMLVAEKGKKHVAKAKLVHDLPQLVSMTFDRGRVELGIQVTDHAAVKKTLNQYPLTLANEIGEILKNDKDASVSLESINLVQSQLNDDFKKRRKKNTTAVIVFIVFIIAIIMMVASSI